MTEKEYTLTQDNNHAPIIEPTEASFDVKEAIQEVISYIENRGFVFEPWQIAQYITAIRTKPFVILAGITGTGKSKLPALIAEATGGVSHLIPVRPDWTDSSDVLGYSDLQGYFRPGSFLEIAREAMGNNDRFWTCIIDEMNLARVEQYFAEILSRIEDRRTLSEGGFASSPLLGQYLNEDDAEWRDVVLPPNFAIVGTVNMDESSHGFSRKVLDRAFTLELSHVYLGQWQETVSKRNSPPTVHAWPVKSWYPRAMKLSDLTNLTETEKKLVQKAIEALQTINQVLSPAQLQVGYRTRDEIVLFLLHAQETKEAFVDRIHNTVDPLDLALQMKILPRIIGGSAAIKQTLSGLIGWSIGDVPVQNEEYAREKYQDWDKLGRPQRMPQSQFPFLASRLCLMWERLENEGYTSYWL